MTPGIIKKLYHTTAVGLADEEKQEVYPITASGAVYSPTEASSFPSMRLDQILDALNDGYLYIGVASPSTNPGTYNHKVFYLASEAGTYSYFGNIQVSGLTVLKNSGSGWVKEELHISGGGGGGTDLAAVWSSLTKTTADAYANTKIHFDHIPSLFTLRTPITGTAANGTLLGVNAISNGGTSVIGSDSSRIEWEPNAGGTGVGAWHFYGNIYANGWIAAGGIGTGGGGGGSVAHLYDIGDVEINNSTLASGQGIVWDSTAGKWVNANIGGGTVTGVVKRIDVGSGQVTPDTNGVANINNALNSHLNWWTKEYITVTRHYTQNSGTKLATISVGMNNPVSVDIWAPASSSPSSGISDVTLGGSSVVTNNIAVLPAYPTSLPASDVSSWAKQSTKPSYTFSELTSHPTTLSGYGITDAHITNEIVTLGANTIKPVTIDTTQTITGAKTFTAPVRVDPTGNASSYIDIGNARLVYDSGANALHITKKSGSATVGLFADGFVAAGGVAGQTTASYVDLESDQTIGGNKLFTGTTSFNSNQYALTIDNDEINFESRLYIQYNNEDVCLTRSGKTIIGPYPGPAAIGSNKLYVGGSACFAGIVDTGYSSGHVVSIQDIVNRIVALENA